MANCDHNWHRTNGATNEDGSDSFRCLICGANGKSYGIGGAINIDHGNKPKAKPRYWSQTYEAAKIRKEKKRSRKIMLEGINGMSVREYFWRLYLKREEENKKK